MAEAKKAARAAAASYEAANETFTAPFGQFPQFAQFPQFEFPHLEVPGFYREFAEKGIAQAKQNYDRAKTATEEASELFETTCSTAFRGASEYSVKLLDAMRSNTNASFDFFRELMAVKSPSEAVELSSTHARRSFDTYSTQGKELASLAQKVSNDTVEPIKTGFNKALRAVA